MLPTPSHTSLPRSESSTSSRSSTSLKQVPAPPLCKSPSVVGIDFSSPGRRAAHLSPAQVGLFVGPDTGGKTLLHHFNRMTQQVEIKGHGIDGKKVPINPESLDSELKEQKIDADAPIIFVFHALVDPETNKLKARISSGDEPENYINMKTLIKWVRGRNSPNSPRRTGPFYLFVCHASHLREEIQPHTESWKKLGIVILGAGKKKLLIQVTMDNILHILSYLGFCHRARKKLEIRELLACLAQINAESTSAIGGTLQKPLIIPAPKTIEECQRFLRARIQKERVERKNKTEEFEVPLALTKKREEVYNTKVTNAILTQVLHGKREAVKALLPGNPSLLTQELSPEAGNSLLLLACRYNEDPDVALFLIEQKAAIQFTDEKERNVLMHASRKESYIAVVKQLLSDPQIDDLIGHKTKEGETLKDVACPDAYKLIRTAQLRKIQQENGEKRAGVFQVDPSTTSPSIPGLGGERTHPLKTSPQGPIISSRVHVTHSNKRSDPSPPFVAAQKKVEVLLRKNQELPIPPSIDKRKISKGSTHGKQQLALIEACKSGEKKKVEALIKAEKLKWDYQDEEGSTAFSWACRNGHLKIASSLLKTGSVDIDTQNKKGWTPLMYACGQRNFRVVDYLLERGANMNLVNEEHSTCVDIAKWKNSDKVLAEDHARIINLLKKKKQNEKIKKEKRKSLSVHVPKREKTSPHHDEKKLPVKKTSSKETGDKKNSPLSASPPRNQPPSSPPSPHFVRNLERGKDPPKEYVIV